MIHVPITSVCNEEELLDLALFSVANAPKEDDVPKAAYSIIIRYICNKYHKENIKSFTEEDIQRDVQEMVTSYVLAGLTRKGIVDVDFSGDEPIYRLTEEGEKLGDEIVKNEISVKEHIDELNKNKEK